MLKALPILAVLLAGIAPAQEKSRSRFEVASVRPSNPNPDRAAGGNRSWGVGSGNVSLRQIPLKYVLIEAFGIQNYQLEGPEWLNTQPFDILATAPPGSSKEQIAAMLQSLLEDRFGMRSHRETQNVPAFALTVAKGGPLLQAAVPSAAISTPIFNTDARKGEQLSLAAAGPFGNTKMSVQGNVLHYELEAITMDGLARFLNQGLADRPVMNRTGLEGSYAVALDLSAADLRVPGIAPSDEPPGYSVETSLRKLGLQLEPQRLPLEKLVIDRIEKTPTAN